MREKKKQTYFDGGRFLQRKYSLLLRIGTKKIIKILSERRKLDNPLQTHVSVQEI